MRLLQSLVGCGMFLLGSVSTGWAADHVVTANPNLTFSPANLTIDVGDTVTFKNAGGFHNAVILARELLVADVVIVATAIDFDATSVIDAWLAYIIRSGVHIGHSRSRQRSYHEFKKVYLVLARNDIDSPESARLQQLHIAAMLAGIGLTNVDTIEIEAHRDDKPVGRSSPAIPTPLPDSTTQTVRSGTPKSCVPRHPRTFDQHSASEEIEMIVKQDPPTQDEDRRRFFTRLTGMVGAIVLAGALPDRTFADELPHLTTANDSTAKLLNYTEDASTAVAPHEEGQVCANCNFFLGGSTGYGPCRLYAGKAVNAKGWCAGYAAKKT